MGALSAPKPLAQPIKFSCCCPICRYYTEGAHQVKVHLGRHPSPNIPARRGNADELVGRGKNATVISSSLETAGTTGSCGRAAKRMAAWRTAWRGDTQGRKVGRMLQRAFFFASCQSH